MAKKPAKKKPKIKEEFAEFQIKKENSKIMKTIIETLRSIIDETKIRVTPSEFIITAMDPSKICLLQLTLSKEHFDEYNCNNGECEIGLNLDDLDKILKRSANRDILEFLFKEEDQKLRIKMKREEKERTRSFSLNLLDLALEEVPMDNLLKIEYNSTFSINPNLLIEALKDAQIYSEIINIKAKVDEGLIFESYGQIGEMIYELGIDDLAEADLEVETDGSYSIKFLKSILKIASITEKLEIALKTDHPLKMTFELLEGGEIQYFLAPRVDESGDTDPNETLEEL